MESAQYQKIIVGTAQFGMKYGVANTTGIPHQKELRNIIDCCLENNIRYLDTAPAYGNCETILGKTGIKNFKIISKFSDHKKFNYQNLISSLEDSCAKLKVSLISLILLSLVGSCKKYSANFFVDHSSSFLKNLP